MVKNLFSVLPLIEKPELLNDILEETEQLIKIFVDEYQDG